MELQLGLALPSKASELNWLTYESPKGIWWDHNSSPTMSSSKLSAIAQNRKRTFGQAFEQNKMAPPTLLILAPFQANDDEDPKDLPNNSSTFMKNDGYGDCVIGWPPINSWRKKLFRDNNYGVEAEYNRVVGVSPCRSVGRRGLKSKCIKVKMEGEAIARKIDLSLFPCFESLRETLMDMFGKCHEDANSYKLTYQDNEGDWMLADDVTWRSFIQSAQRLNLLNSTGRFRG